MSNDSKNFISSNEILFVFRFNIATTEIKCSNFKTLISSGKTSLSLGELKKKASVDR